MWDITYLLKPEHREAGLSLKEDVDLVYLKHGYDAVATFSREAQPEFILKEADDWMAKR
jgi:hypothetical protein